MNKTPTSTPFKRTLSWALFRLKTLKSHFFDEVYIEDKKLKNTILKWIFNLKYYKDISIDEFSLLFSGLEGIIFPIRIYGNSRRLLIKDYADTNYHFLHCTRNYDEMDQYSIILTTDSYEKEFCYHISNHNEIILDELLITQLDEDNIRTANTVSFYYDRNSKVTSAVLETATSTIEVSYPSLTYIHDSQIATYLFCLANEFEYIDDVSFMLSYITDVINTLKRNYSLTIKSFDNSNNILLSKICLSDGMITNYSLSVRYCISEICLYQKFPNEKLQNFLSRHKH